MKPIRVAFGRSLWSATSLPLPSPSANARLLGERGETPAALRIREVTPADIAALSRLHVTTWNATYAPAKGPPYEVREWQWREEFAKQDGSWFCYVVERENGELVGFAKGKRSDNPAYAGELNKIYLLREYQRLGLGKRLVGYVARRFLSEGIDSMWLYAEATNPSAGFYEALGGHNCINGDGTVNYGNYGWRDLRTLVATCPPE